MTGARILAMVLGALGAAAPACGRDSEHPITPDGSDATAPPDAGASSSTPVDAGSPPLAHYPRPCPAIYAQDVLPTFEVEIAPEDWREVLDDARARRERWHPLSRFRWGDLVARQAHLRLKGRSTWSTQKLQFVISFKQADPDGRFLGLRAIVLDASDMNPSYLRDRLALSVLRDLGVPAPCANNARLVVNGDYYGLYANIEKVDREFLERSFDRPEGNLYKYGRTLKTNEDERPDTSRLDALREVDDIDVLAALVDLEAAVLEWAGEAALLAGDGYVVGRANYYLYDHPARGFLWIPWDLDATFDWAPVDADPIRYIATREVKPAAFSLVIEDAAGRARYLEALAEARRAVDPATLVARIDAWREQIRDAAAEDPHREFTLEDHLDYVEELREHVVDRAAFLDRWLACAGGADAGDADRDRIAWCHDCDEVSCRRH